VQSKMITFDLLSGKSLKLLPPGVKFKPKMHQIRFRLGLAPKPTPECSPDPLAEFKGPILLREGGDGKKGMGVEKKGRYCAVLKIPQN